MSKDDEKPYEGFNFSVPRGSLELPGSPLKSRAQEVIDSKNDVVVGDLTGGDVSFSVYDKQGYGRYKEFCGPKFTPPYAGGSKKKAPTKHCRECFLDIPVACKKCVCGNTVFPPKHRKN